MPASAGYGTAKMTMSPATVAVVSVEPMCSTSAPPALSTPSMAVPMLPDPKIVTLVISAPVVVSRAARFGCCYNYNMVVATTTVSTGTALGGGGQWAPSAPGLAQE